MGEQASLFDLGPESTVVPVAKRLPMVPRNPRQKGPVVVQLTMDERAEETRWMAEWYEDLELGCCPIPEEPDGSPKRCPLRKCREHLMVPRNGDDLKTQEELNWEWAWMPYHCIKDFIRDHPTEAKLEDIGLAMRTSRQTVQDDLIKATSDEHWDWESRYLDMLHHLGLPDSIPFPGEAFKERWLRMAAEEMRLKAQQE